MMATVLAKALQKNKFMFKPRFLFSSIIISTYKLEKIKKFFYNFIYNIYFIINIYNKGFDREKNWKRTGKNKIYII